MPSSRRSRSARPRAGSRSAPARCGSPNNFSGTVSRIDPSVDQGGADDPGRQRAERGCRRRRLGVGHQQQRRHAHPDRRGQRRGHPTRSRSAAARPMSPRARRGVGERRGERAGAADRPADRPGHRDDQRRHGAERDRRRLRVGVGREQPRRDGLADRPADQPGGGDDPGRRRAQRDRCRRWRGVGRQRVRRQRRPHRPGHGQRSRARITVGNRPRGVAIVGRPGVGERAGLGRQPPRRHADRASERPVRLARSGPSRVSRLDSDVCT